MARNVEFDEERAVRAAMEVFWEKGYKGASLRHLTEAMQINPSSLYNTIGDKHALFLRCVQCYTDDRKKYIAEHARSTRPPLETIGIFIDDAVASITTSARSCMAIKAAFEVAAEDERVQAILKEDNDAMYRFLRELLTRAIAAGAIPGEEDPELLTDYLLSSYIGWHESYLVNRDAKKIEGMARFLLRQLTR